MQLLILVTVGVLFGAVACDVECFKQKKDACSQKVFKQAEHLEQLEFCDFQKKLINCLTEAAEDCEMKLVPEMKKVNNLVEKLCESGSNLNKKFLKREKCYVAAATDLKCYESVINIFKDANTAEEIAESQKEACRHIREIADCTVERARDTCGNDVVAFYRFLIRPIADLQEKFCEEVVFQDNGNEKRSMPDIFHMFGIAF